MTKAHPPLAPGVWGILATPFDGPVGPVDVASLVTQIALYSKVGARGVVAVGVFGEAAKLSASERREVIAATADTSEHLGIVIGLTPLATSPAIEQAQAAVDGLGDRLTGVMVQVNSSSPDLVIEHLGAIHSATGAGIVLQDYPKISGIHIGSDSLVEILDACPYIVAVKAEAPPTPVAIAGLTRATDIPIFGGLGGVGLIDELAAGAAGAMTGFSYPEGLVAAVDAFQADGFAAAHRAFAPWLPIANFESQEGLALTLRKAILHARGIIANPSPRRPAPPFPESLRATMLAHLEVLGTAVPQIESGR